MIYVQIKIYLLIFIFLFPYTALSQQYFWIQKKDKEGNKFYIDKNGKISTSGTPDFKYKPVSYEGLDYYLNQGIELIKRHYIPEGLTLLKSIMALPVTNNRVHQAQVKASMEIQKLKRKEGIRFQRICRKASILLFRDSSYIYLINDKMLYSLKIPFNINIIRTNIRERHNYYYYGLLLGLKLNTKRLDKKYDALMAVDSEKFISKLKSVNQLEFHWKTSLGKDSFDRRVVHSSDQSIIYFFKDRSPPYFSGFEGFYIKDNYGYFLKTIFHKNLHKNHVKTILNIVKGFKI